MSTRSMGYHAEDRPGVYAAGDVALAHHEIAGRHVATEHWQDAIEQGKIAGGLRGGTAREMGCGAGLLDSVGGATLKYHAWGDGYERSRMLDQGDSFTVWYDSENVLGERLIAERRPAPVPMS